LKIEGIEKTIAEMSTFLLVLGTNILCGYIAVYGSLSKALKKAVSKNF
jgi:hypothetical protein